MTASSVERLPHTARGRTRTLPTSFPGRRRPGFQSDQRPVAPRDQRRASAVTRANRRVTICPQNIETWRCSIGLPSRYSRLRSSHTVGTAVAGL